jgi:Secretion system C-terminal sorting domain
LWASDFYEYGEDNCTPANQLKFGVTRENAATPTNLAALSNITFDCSDVKAGTTVVWVWVQDQSGNIDYCANYVKVQDNLAGACGASGSMVTVAGVLRTAKTEGIGDGNVNLEGSHPALPPVSLFKMTNDAGEYRFSNAIPLAGNYTLTPIKDDNPLNGVSTYDLVLISKHILGLEPLSTPYKMIAADANNSNSITASDIVELRKLILGVYTDLPNNNSWRFVDKLYVFPDPANPFGVAFPENKTVAEVLAARLADDFVGMKIGDVNTDAVANDAMSVEDRSTGTLCFEVEDRTVNAGDVFDLTMTAAERVQGFQFTLAHAGLELVDIVPNDKTGVDNFGVFRSESMLTASFDAADAVPNGMTNAAITLKFRAKRAGKLSDLLKMSNQITRTEAYNTDGARYDAALRFKSAAGTTIRGVGFELYQNTPNPVKNATAIRFNLPEAGAATLRITDMEGRVIKQMDGLFAKGLNTVTVNGGELPKGVLFYELCSGNNTAAKKMIVVE